MRHPFGRKFNYNVVTLGGDIVHKFYTYKVAVAYAILINGFAVNR